LYRCGSVLFQGLSIQSSSFQYYWISICCAETARNKISFRNFMFNIKSMPVPMSAQSKPRTAFNRPNTGIVGSNPARGMGVSTFLCVVLSCGGSGLATGRSSVQGVLLNVQKYIYKFQKRNSESEKTRGPNSNLI
jgi:hypothetical protein